MRSVCSVDRRADLHGKQSGKGAEALAQLGLVHDHDELRHHLDHLLGAAPMPLRRARGRGRPGGAVARGGREHGFLVERAEGNLERLSRSRVRSEVGMATMSVSSPDASFWPRRSTAKYAVDPVPRPTTMPDSTWSSTDLYPTSFLSSSCEGAMARAATAARGCEARCFEARRGVARRATEEDRRAADMMAGARECGSRRSRSRSERSEPSIRINRRPAGTNAFCGVFENFVHSSQTHKNTKDVGNVVLGQSESSYASVSRFDARLITRTATPPSGLRMVRPRARVRAPKGAVFFSGVGVRRGTM